MSGRDFLPEIRDKIWYAESPEDVVRMIDLAAEARSELLGRRPTEEDYRFAGKLLCIIFDPLKPEKYRDEVSKIRLRFLGIAKSAETQEQFKRALNAQLLTGGVEEVFRAPVTEMFAILPDELPVV